MAAKEAPPRPRTKQRSRPTVAEGGPHPVDVHVGSRVRLARLLAGRTQEWLGNQVGLTFQQIQKYERGANRVSCSMLSEFATALDRSVSWFFQEGPNEADPKAPDAAIGERQRLTYELTSNFAKIRSEKARQHIVGLVRSVADSEPSPKRSAAAQ
ncbi:MAG TPA: helix-turn-helix transcriptional regulator [Stellaceae bacterium]|nr:helix-turn-helix transcriptional regulator [Stellaceae bacterium]